MKAAFGQVSNVRPVQSQGVTRIEIEVPIEAHVAVTELLFGKTVLVTVAGRDLADKYGILDSEIPRASEDAAREAEGVGTASAVALQSRAPGHPPNELARALHSTGYFLAPGLWQAVEYAQLYTQRDHHAYLKTLPCAGARIRESIACSGEIVPHHCKHVAAKLGDPDHPQKVQAWYEAPLCAIGHHQNWVHGTGRHCATREEREELKRLALQITAQRMKDAMKERLHIASLAELTPQLWRKWSEQIGYAWKAGDAVAEGMQ